MATMLSNNVLSDVIGPRKGTALLVKRAVLVVLGVAALAVAEFQRQGFDDGYWESFSKAWHDESPRAQDFIAHFLAALPANEMYRISQAVPLHKSFEISTERSIANEC